MELREYLQIILKRLWIIILITILAALVSGFVSYFMLDKIYESSTTLIVNKQKDDSGQETPYSYNDILLSQKLVKTYSEIAKSTFVLDRVIQELNLPYTLGELNEKISVSAVGETQIIRITVEDQDPGRAQDIATTFAKVLPERVKELEMPDNVKIVDTAKLPTSPVKPRPMLNILVAVFTGIMAGLGIVFLIEYLDNTIKTPDDVQRYLDLPIIGSIPNFNE